jgi:ATP-binding cassette subfamily C (CFTR/MRP) protein 1
MAVPQHAWVQSGTIRDNIIFGSKYDHVRLREVIDACGLRSDLDMLASGDM